MCLVTTTTASGARHRPRMARAGCRPTISPLSTAWRSTAGTMDLCHATRQSTCSAQASTEAFWSARARAAPARGPFLCGTRGESTITGLTLRLTARWESGNANTYSICTARKKILLTSCSSKPITCSQTALIPPCFHQSNSKTGAL